ncbi:hypothetical protein [Bifidobacterium felsineum]|uniref:Peptide ABC transporter permease n=1 Tax=Bifidobacterium felsineum TaxID=2045440 RepID=A0A2M9HJI2_9BIFI|nr:hypothetical protein CSQ86_07630 [Bifidobacterium felsineum]
MVQQGRNRVTGTSRGNGAPKKRKRKISKRQQAIYRRRRIVVGIVLALIVALVVFCVYSIGRGIGAINTMIHHDDVYAIAREATPTPKSTSNVKKCSVNDLTLELSSKSQSVAVGGTLEFTASIVHEGSNSCLVDGSDSGRVLTITSGSETIYQSGLCAPDSRWLLMAKGDKDVQQLKWNTDYNSTLTECTDETSWPKVNPGTYTAQIALKDAPKVKSDPLTFTVQ